MITFTFASVLWNVFFTAYDPYVSTIGNIISCCFLGSIFILIEKFLVQYIAVSFHERAYKDRLIENKFMEYVIETLFEARRLIKERSKKKRGSTQQAYITN